MSSWLACTAQASMCPSDLHWASHTKAMTLAVFAAPRSHWGREHFSQALAICCWEVSVHQRRLVLQCTSCSAATRAFRIRAVQQLVQQSDPVLCRDRDRHVRESERAFRAPEPSSRSDRQSDGRHSSRDGDRGRERDREPDATARGEDTGKVAHGAADPAFQEPEACTSRPCSKRLANLLPGFTPKPVPVPDQTAVHLSFSSLSRVLSAKLHLASASSPAHGGRILRGSTSARSTSGGTSPTGTVTSKRRVAQTPQQGAKQQMGRERTRPGSSRRLKRLSCACGP